MENRFTLTTKQCQLLVIALISAKHRNSPFEQQHAEEFGKLTDLFTDLNRMCNKDNDYRLTFEVKRKSTMNIIYRDVIGIMHVTLPEGEAGKEIDFSDGYAYFTAEDKNGDFHDRKVPLEDVIQITRD